MNSGEIIRKLRQSNGLTQDEMAEKLFVTRQAVSRWENGDTLPNIDTLRIMSRIFDIPINNLVDVKALSGDGNGEKNADRFLGFADVYDNNRPSVPKQAVDIIVRYLGKAPGNVVDIGCGTGLSVAAWDGRCGHVTGIDPSDDMLAVARLKENEHLSFIKAFSHDTGLPAEYADAVVCSQSFHWMNPQDTLREVDRILRCGGAFAAIDCDWPPVCGLKAEMAYAALFNKVRIIEEENADVRHTFTRWNKEDHLNNIRSSGYFRYSREIVFSSVEQCSAERFIGLAMSQGSLQTILKLHPELIENDYRHFCKAVYASFEEDAINEMTFCYRMRIGIK